MAIIASIDEHIAKVAAVSNWVDGMMKTNLDDRPNLVSGVRKEYYNKPYQYQYQQGYGCSNGWGGKKTCYRTVTANSTKRETRQYTSYGLMNIQSTPILIAGGDRIEYVGSNQWRRVKTNGQIINYTEDEYRYEGRDPWSLYLRDSSNREVTVDMWKQTITQAGAPTENLTTSPVVDSFNKSSWDQLSNPTKRDLASGIYNHNKLSLTSSGSSIKSQNPATLGNPVLSTKNATSVGSFEGNIQGVIDGQLQTDNNDNVLEVTLEGDSSQFRRANLTFNAEVPISVKSITSNGVLNTQRQDISSDFEAKSEAQSFQMNKDLVGKAAINTSTLDAEESVVNVPFQKSTRVTLRPNQKIKVSLQHTLKEIIMPFESIVNASNNYTLTDKFNNKMTKGLGDLGIKANMLQGNASTFTINPSSSNLQLKTSGSISSTNATDFKITYLTILPDTTSQTRSQRKSQSAKPIDHHEELEVNGELIKTGISHHPKSSKKHGAVLPGSHQNDVIHMKGKNQIVHTHKGQDTIYGSKYGDKIYLYEGGDRVESGDGPDVISNLSGSHFINAGKGDDIVKIDSEHSDHTYSNEVYLGKGQDKLKVKISNKKSSDLIVYDLHPLDSIKFSLSEKIKLSGSLHGNSVEIFSNGNHFGNIVHYGREMDKFVDKNNINYADLGLLNMDVLTSYSSTHEFISDWRDDLVIASALGDNLVYTYEDFIESSKRKFMKNTNALQKYMYDEVDVSFSKKMYSRREKFDDIREFSSNLLRLAGKSGKDADIPVTNFELLTGELYAYTK